MGFSKVGPLTLPDAALLALYESTRLEGRTPRALAVERALAARLRAAGSLAAGDWRYTWSHGRDWFVRTPVLPLGRPKGTTARPKKTETGMKVVKAGRRPRRGHGVQSG